MYDAHDLHPNDVTSSAWAIAHARRFLADVREPYEYAQAEIYALLDAHAFVHESVTYYRPHVTAASLIRTDPNRATQESIDNAQRTYRPTALVVADIIREGAWIDDLIETATGVRPRSGRTLEPVF